MGVLSDIIDDIYRFAELLISGNQLDSGEWRTSFLGRLGLSKARQFQIRSHDPILQKVFGIIRA
jgi:hypothetical protein